MKKLTFFILYIALITLSACGSKKPKDMSEEAYNASKKIISLTDDYLKMDIGYDEYYEEVNELAGRIKDSSYGSDSLAILYADGIKHYATMYEMNNSILDKEEDGYEDIIEQRNELAELIGESKYK